MAKTIVNKRKFKFGDLTDHQAKFVLEYPIDFDGQAAAIRAGYSKNGARQRARTLLGMKKVRDALTKVMKQDLKRTEVKREDVLREIANAVTWRADDLFEDDGSPRHPNDLPDRVQCQVDGYECDEWYDGEGNLHRKIKLKTSPRATAREQVMKHEGLYAAENHRHLVASIPWDELCGAINPTDTVEARLLEEESKGAKQ